jgi:hypothetical protein
MTTKPSGEPFLDRWSRLKRESETQSVEVPGEAPPPEPEDAKAAPPELPPVDQLTFDSDYRAFFHPKVSEDTRRAALKKLFSDARFNVMDGLDVYIDDYSKSEPIPPAMLAGLRQAQKILEWAKGEGPETKEAHTDQRVVPENRVALQDGSPSFPAPDPAKQIDDSPIPAASEPPDRGPKR